MPSVAEDFVGRFRQQGLEHLTQGIMLILISPEEEGCSLTEAKLVSSLWREAVDNLVLNTDKGKDMYLHRIKNMMRRAVCRLDKRASERSAPVKCPCLRRSTDGLMKVQDPNAYLTALHQESNSAKRCHFWSLEEKSGCQEHIATDFSFLMDSVTRKKREADAWKARMLKWPASEEMDDCTRAVRAILVYRLFWLPHDPDLSPRRRHFLYHDGPYIE